MRASLAPNDHHRQSWCPEDFSLRRVQREISVVACSSRPATVRQRRPREKTSNIVALVLAHVQTSGSALQMSAKSWPLYSKV
jgi:hypothetical protein